MKLHSRLRAFVAALGLLATSAIAAPPAAVSSLPVFALGTTAGTAAAGNDSRITNALQSGVPIFLSLQTTPAVSADGYLHSVQNSTTSAQNVYSSILPTTSYENDGVRSTMLVPSGSKGQTNSLAFYGINQADANAQLVGLWGIVKCNASGATCWDENPTITDTIDNTVANSFATKLVGAEYDISVYNTGTVVCGVCLTGSSAVIPKGADAFVVGDLHAASPGITPWTHGFVVNDGTSLSALYAGVIGPNPGANSQSTPVEMVYRDSSNAGQKISIFAALDSVYMRRSGYSAGLNFLFSSGAGPTIAPDSSVATPLNLKGAVGGGVNVNDSLTVTGVQNNSGALNVNGGSVKASGGFVTADGAAAIAASFGSGAASANSQSGIEAFNYRDSANSSQAIRQFAAFDTMYWRRVNFANGFKVQTSDTTSPIILSPDSSNVTPMQLQGANSGGLILNDMVSVIKAESHAISTVTASFTYDATMQAVMAGTRSTALTAAVTGTLPACVAATKGRSYVLKKRDTSSNNVTLAAAGSDTIDGAATVVLTAQNAVVSARCDGAGSWERGLTP